LPLDHNQVKEIIHHIADINAGMCSITETQIEEEEHDHMREVLVGLMTMHEDLQYENKIRAESQEALATINKALRIEKDKLLETRISKEYSTKRIHDATEAVMAIGGRNFENKMEVSPEGDEFDGLAIGLNMLSEELEASTISIDYLNDILDSQSDILIVTDDKGDVKFHNTAATKKLGKIYGQTIFHIIQTLRPKIDIHLLEKKFSTLLSEKSKDKRFKILIKSIIGEELPLDISISIMRYTKGVIIVGRNMSERIRSENERRKLVSQLYTANSELKEMMYILSHDLKAPLRGVSTLSDWIYEDLQGKVDETTNKNLILLSNRVKKMYSLLEGILSYSKIGNNVYNKEEINLSYLIRELFDTLENKNNIKIIFDTELPIIHNYKTQFIQLFQNLISNGIKYIDKPEGKINIGHTEKSNFWQFYVQDNGPGINIKNHEKIFKIFQTLQKSESFENSGIGLSIVKKIVSQNNGKIWVESELTKGTTFFFTIQK